MPKDNSPSNPSPSPPHHYHHHTTGRANAIFYSPFEFHRKNLVAYIMTQMILTSARVVLPLKRLTVELYGYIWKPSVHTRIYITYIRIYIYICYHAHTYTRPRAAGSCEQETWPDSPSTLYIRRSSRCRNSAIFAFYFAPLQHRHRGSALSRISKIPITRNRILTHVYKYLNAFIIHIYTHRRLGVFSPAYTRSRRYIVCTHTHSHRVCHFDVIPILEKTNFCNERVCFVLIPNLRKNGTHRIFECVFAPCLFII